MTRRLARASLAVTVLTLLAGPAVADSHEEAGPEVVAVGSTLPAFSFEDQHGEAHTLDDSVKLVLFTRDMDAGDIVKETLAENGGEVLAARGAVYISDVHRMPSLIRRIFALPSMRDRPYPMWLDVEGEDTRILPANEGQPTLIHLEAMKVTRIESPASGAALREALGMPPAPEGEED